MTIIQFLLFVFQDVGVFSTSNVEELEAKYKEFISGSRFGQFFDAWYFQLILALVAPFVRRYVCRLYDAQKAELTDIILQYLSDKGYVIEKQ